MPVDSFRSPIGCVLFTTAVIMNIIILRRV